MGSPLSTPPTTTPTAHRHTKPLCTLPLRRLPPSAWSALLCPAGALRVLLNTLPAHPAPAMMSVFTPVSLTGLGAPPGHPAGSLRPCLAQKQFFFGLDGVGLHRVLNFHELPMFNNHELSHKKIKFPANTGPVCLPGHHWQMPLYWGQEGPQAHWASSRYRSRQALGALESENPGSCGARSQVGMMVTPVGGVGGACGGLPDAHSYLPPGKTHRAVLLGILSFL